MLQWINFPAHLYRYEPLPAHLYSVTLHQLLFSPQERRMAASKTDTWLPWPWCSSPVVDLLSPHNISSHIFVSPLFRLQAGRHDGGWAPELWARVVMMAGGGGGSFIPSLLFLYWFKSWFFLYWLSQSIVSPFPYMIIFSVQLICTIKYWFHKRKIDVAFLNVKYWYCILKL